MDPVIRRRIAALLLIAGAIVAGLAIADVGPFSDPPTEEERAQDAVEEFFAAAGERDFKEFCGLLTAPARAGIEQQAGVIAAAQDLTGCKEIIGALIGDEFKDVEVVVQEVSVSGPQARIEANLKFAGETGNQPRTIYLEQQPEGEWLISDFG